MVASSETARLGWRAFRYGYPTKVAWLRSPRAVTERKPTPMSNGYKQALERFEAAVREHAYLGDDPGLSPEQKGRLLYEAIDHLEEVLSEYPDPRTEGLDEYDDEDD